MRNPRSVDPPEAILAEQTGKILFASHPAKYTAYRPRIAVCPLLDAQRFACHKPYLPCRAAFFELTSPFAP